MVKSPLSPERITKTNNKNLEGALKFVSGGSPLGSSVVSSAANKIVGFNRAKVSPKQTNFKSLIETLSSNIFNNISSVQNVFNNKTEKKEKGMSFFSGIFDKVKEALAFVRFFGEKKNLDKIKTSLNNLKDTFGETFEVAKALRKAIVKIFKELSGINASGGGGGLGNILSSIGGLLGGLIPGRKGARELPRGARALEGEGNMFSKIPKMMKGGGGGIGKLLLGGGLAAGGIALSGLSAGAGNTEYQPGETPTEIPGNLLDKFNSILDRFDKILDGLKGGKGTKGAGSGAKSSGSGGGSPTPTPTPTSLTGPIQYGPLPLSMSNKQAFSSIYELAKKNGDPMPELTAAQAMFESGYLSSSNTKNLNNPFGQSGTGNKGSSGRWAAYNSLEDSVKDHINKWQKDYKGYKGMGTYGSPLEGLRSSINAYAPASENNQANYLKAVASILATMGFDPNKKNPIVDLSTNALIQQRKPGASGITAPTAPVLPSPEQIAQTQGLSVQRRQGNSSVVVLPGTQQQTSTQQSGGGQVFAPPSPAKSGPEMPRLLASNPDNFLNLYSKMVYNIIDG